MQASRIDLGFADGGIMQVLVAEVDETGEIDALWRWEDGMRSPRPLRAAREIAGDIATAEVSGADRARIARWLAAAERRIGTGCAA